MDAEDLQNVQQLANKPRSQQRQRQLESQQPSSPLRGAHAMAVFHSISWGSPSPPLSPRAHYASCSLASLRSSPRVKPRA